MPIKKIINIQWAEHYHFWAFRKVYEDGSVSDFIQTLLGVNTSADQHEFQKWEMEFRFIGQVENVPDETLQLSFFDEEKDDGRLIAHLLMRLDDLLVRLKRMDFVPEARALLVKAAFSFYVQLFHLGAKAWADQLLEKHGIDHTKKSVVSSV